MTDEEIEIAEIIEHFYNELDEAGEVIKSLKSGVNSLVENIEAVKKADRSRFTKKIFPRFE